MNVLWLPHAPLRTGRARSDHFIEGLAHRHHVTVLSFRIHPKRQVWRYLLDLVTHRSRHGGLYDERAIWRFPKLPRLSGWLLNQAIERELGRRRYDVLVVAPAPYLTGYLDFASFGPRIAIVCDYLDGSDWVRSPHNAAFERLYVGAADAVMCASRGLMRQALTVNANARYIPNGVELQRYREFRASHTTRDCKEALRISPDTYVVSIIGMTCSASLYFVDAIVALARKGRKVLLLLVGDSPLLGEIQRRAGDFGNALRIVGAVPYAEVLPYFMATDLGLSAVDDIPYYHFQSPLKIFEYSAMGKPVLAAPSVEEVAMMNLSNVRFCGADADSLARHIESAMNSTEPCVEPNLESYNWDRLTREVEDLLSRTSAVKTSSRI
jgi:glycosyltransferase involved in cell wall biosynthesis